MPDNDLNEYLFRLIQDAVPASLKKENEEKAKNEYEEYKLDKNFKKVEELNPLTLYFIIRDLKGNEQVRFIIEHIDYIRKNDESIFIYSMMAPKSLSHYLSYDSLKELSILDKNIFNKILGGNVEGILDGFSDEEVFSFFNEFDEEINKNMNEHLFVNFYLYARQKIFATFRPDDITSFKSWEETLALAKKECARLTSIVLDKYGDKIAKMNDEAFFAFFSNVLDLEDACEYVNKFCEDNRQRLINIYKTINPDKLFESFEDLNESLHKKIFEEFGEVILNRGDLKKYFITINSSVLADCYKKNKKYFVNINVEDWLKIPFFNEELETVLDDYIDCDFEKLFNSGAWLNRDGIACLERKYRNNISDEKLFDLDKISSIYSNEYIKNIEVIRRMVMKNEIDRNSDEYKANFKFFVNYLMKEGNIVEVNKDTIRELERYFFLVVKGLSFNHVKKVDGINKVALYNRLGEKYNIDEKEFSLEQIQMFNVKEYKLLLDVWCVKNNSDFVKTYQTLVLKLMLLVGYDKAKYILTLDGGISTLEHLVGNVDVRGVKLDEHGNPILNKKIINLLFKDLRRNRIELMLRDKTSELYKYFPRIFNEWDLIEINKRNKDLRTIIEFLKSDDVCVGVKYYRLKGLFKYIGCNKDIVSDTLKLHDEMISRVFSAIPRIKGELREYTYEVLKLKDMEGLTVGNKTNCCFTVRGNAYSSLKHALTSKDGRILVVKKNGELVAHSWMWRNGNVLCLDNIEVLKGVEVIDFLDVYLKFSEEIIQKSSCYESGETCLRNVVIGRTTFDKKVIGLEEYRSYVTVIDNELEKNVVTMDKLPNVGVDNIYSDAKKRQVLINGDGDFRCYDNECYYEDEREGVLSYSIDNIDHQEAVLNIINCLRYIKYEQEDRLEQFELIDLSNYSNIWCNDDWYITIDKEGKVEKFALLYDERAKEEIKNVLNNKIEKGCKKNIKCV